MTCPQCGSDDIHVYDDETTMIQTSGGRVRHMTYDDPDKVCRVCEHAWA